MNEIRKYDLDWSKADLEMAKLILKQGEIHLDCQLRISLAADQRAMVTGGILAAFAASVIAASLNTWGATHNPDLLVLQLGLAVALLFGAVYSVRAARPVPFCHAGSEPLKWWDFRESENLAQAIGGEAENYQFRIETNNAILKRNAKRFARGLHLALASPIIAVATWSAYRLLLGAASFLLSLS
jgi:hypothetical protein